MQATDQAERKADPKRFSGTVVWLACGIILFFFAYQHLAGQAFSQGFVLEELAPLIEAWAGFGKAVYRLGGNPHFIPVIGALFLAAAALLFSRPVRESLATNRLLVAVALAISLMWIMARFAILPLHAVGLIAIFLLGAFGQRNSMEQQSDAAPMRNVDRLLLAGIVLLALVLRLYKLDVFSHIQGIDEQLFAQDALEMFDDPAGFFGVPAWEKAHLVRIAAVRLTFSTLGVGLFQNRTVSVIEGVPCILLVYMLCRKLWGNRAGILAALMVCLDPWHIGYSRAGVHEIEGPLFLTLLLLLLIRAVRNGGKWNFAALGAVTGLTLYLYQSCAVMAPFAFGAALMGGVLARKESKSRIAAEMLVMGGVFAIVLIPHLTFGRGNLMELLSGQTMSKNFLAASEDYSINPIVMLFGNFWSAVEHMFSLSPDMAHPSRVFYPIPIMMGLALLGLGVLAGSKKRYESLLLLAWIPFSFLPTFLGYGFVERRLFPTLLPIPAILAGLTLAKLWDSDGPNEKRKRNVYARALVVLLLVAMVLMSAYITFEDVQIVAGGAAHPRKAAEFVRSLPPSYLVVVSSKIKDFPFIFYITNYDRLRREGGRKFYSFVEFEEIRQAPERIADTPGSVVVTDPGIEEELFLKEIKALNPSAEIVKSEDYWACIVPGNGR